MRQIQNIPGFFLTGAITLCAVYLMIQIFLKAYICTYIMEALNLKFIRKDNTECIEQIKKE
jgi:hypothetical protein